MKKVIRASTDSIRRTFRSFAKNVCENAFEDYELTVGYTLGAGHVIFTVYRDESMQSVHCTYVVENDNILDVYDDPESYADLVDDVVNTLYRKQRQAL